MLTMRNMDIMDTLEKLMLYTERGCLGLRGLRGCRSLVTAEELQGGVERHPGSRGEELR